MIHPNHNCTFKNFLIDNKKDIHVFSLNNNIGYYNSLKVTCRFLATEQIEENLTISFKLNIRQRFTRYSSKSDRTYFNLSVITLHYTHKYTTHTTTLHTQLHYTHNYTTHTNTLHTQLHYTHNYTAHTTTLHTQLQYTPNYTTHTTKLHLHYTHDYTTHTTTLHT